MNTEFYCSINRATQTMYASIADENDNVLWSKQCYCAASLSGSSEQRLRSSMAEDAAYFCKENNMPPAADIPRGIINKVYS